MTTPSQDSPTGDSGRTPPDAAAGPDDLTRRGEDDDFAPDLAALAAAPPRYGGPPPTLGPGDAIGEHYTVERQLGAGGMGVVHLAVDHRLGRKVAIKLQLGQRSAQDVHRLEREGRAMASLSHPNVLGVYEVGRHEGHLFIAMEFADGGTLQDWIDASERPWRDVVALFASLAAGLHAAHETGIVHRDFKPANVLLGSDGRPRIADFGLALGRSVAAPVHESDPSLDARLTATGAIVGTPAYMAPEQFASSQTSAASDQFAFFIALHEALYGHRPFRARSIPKLAAEVCSDQPLPIPFPLAGPRQLFKIIERGLSVAPSDRFGSLDEVRIALLGIAKRRRRRIATAVLSFAAVAASVTGYQSAVALNPSACDDAAASEVWTDERREALARGLSDPPAPIEAQILAQLDRYGTELAEARTAACEASRVQGRTSESVYELTVACLGKLESRLGAAADEFEQGRLSEPDAPKAVAELFDSTQTCLQPEKLMRLSNRWSRTSARMSAEAITEHRRALTLVTRAHLLLTTRPAEAAALVDEAEPLAKTHGFLDVLKTVQMLRAQLASLHGEHDRASELRATAFATAAQEGDPGALAQIALIRAEQGAEDENWSEARLHHEYFAALTRALDLDLEPRQQLTASLVEARLALHDGDFDRVAELLTFADDDTVDPIQRRIALSVLGQRALHLGDYPEASRQFGRALEAREPTPGQPDVRRAALLTNAAIADGYADRRAALRRLAEAEEIVRAVGEHDEMLSTILNNQGRQLRRLGDLETAFAKQQAALTLGEAALGKEHPDLAYALDELGELERVAGNLEAAEAHLMRAAGIRDGAYGAGNRYVAETITRIARVYLDQGKGKHALNAAQIALDVREKKSARPDMLASTLFELARSHALLGDSAEALVHARRALELCNGPNARCEELTAQLEALIEDGATNPAP